MTYPKKDAPLFQLQQQRLDPLGVLPLLLRVPLGYLRKPGAADFLAHVIFVKPLEKPVKFFRAGGFRR